jgi:tetratricopeptide (TPR) repeat protein
MRVVPLILSILLCSRVLLPAAPKVSDSGVPTGWSALQYDNFGNDLLNKQRPVEARKYFDAAIRIAPSRWTAYYNRATAFRLEKNWKAAINDLNETIRLQPAFFQASWDRALTYEAMGDYTAAIKDLNALAKVTYQVGNPYEMALTLNQRAWIRATCSNASFRDGKAAVEDAKKACDLVKWKRAQYIDTLAAASAEAGNFDSAVRYEQQAIDLNRSGKDETIQKTGDPVGDKVAIMMANKAQQSLPGYFKRLELYKQHRPYHAAAAH